MKQRLEAMIVVDATIVVAMGVVDRSSCSLAAAQPQALF
jgi:hypothetical protein